MEHYIFIYMLRKELTGWKYLIEAYAINKGSGKDRSSLTAGLIQIMSVYSAHRNHYSIAAPTEISQLRNLWYCLCFNVLTGLIGVVPGRSSVLTMKHESANTQMESTHVFLPGMI